jgi:hypothetical protein
MSLIEDNQHLFKKREGDQHHANHMGMMSQFKTLFHEEMPDELIEAIMKNFPEELQETFEFLQIQKYDIGDYIVPHKDKYDIIKLHLCHLTSSKSDGTTIQVGEGIETILDKAGQYLDFPYDSWHWVNPVLEHTRYSLVVGE